MPARLAKSPPSTTAAADLTRGSVPLSAGRMDVYRVDFEIGK